MPKKRKNRKKSVVKFSSANKEKVFFFSAKKVFIKKANNGFVYSFSFFKDEMTDKR
jgi:hypothetical protein